MPLTTLHSLPPDPAPLSFKAALLRAWAGGHDSLIAAVAAWVGGALSRSETVAVFFCCLAGGAVCGFAGSVLGHVLPGPDSSVISDKKRWLVNFLAAAVFGPLTTWWVRDNWLPGAPLEFVAFAVSGAFGILFVTLLFYVPDVIRHVRARGGTGTGTGGNGRGRRGKWLP